MTEEKVLVIGWDGATFDILNRWLQEGIMPNLSHLIENGISRELMSTIPPLTAPAWSSFMTGKNPGKHGVFSFTREFDDGSTSLNNLNSIEGSRLWTVLNHYGQRVGVADLPMTYPPEELEGFMVSDLMVSGSKRALTYPPELKSKILKELDLPFESAIMDNLSQTTNYLEHLISSLESKKELDVYLMNNYEWDCFITVYSQVDILQHYFWKYLDKSHPQYNPEKAMEFQDFIRDFFIELDQSLGNILDQVEGNLSVVLISDHGFGPVHKFIYLNKFLHDHAYIAVNHNLKEMVKSLLNKLGITPSSLKKLLYRFDFLNLQGKLRKELRQQFRDSIEQGLNPSVNWKKSKAYFKLKGEQGVYINSRLASERSDYEKLREELRDTFLSIIDPDTEKAVFENVYKKEEVYRGKYTDQAPDILLQPAVGYDISIDLHADSLIGVKDQGFGSGFHRPNGVFIAEGNHILENEKLQPAELIDIAPTVLYIAGVPVPEDMDGQVLSDIFDPSHLESCPVEYMEPLEHTTKATGPDYSEEHQKEVEKRLKDLGYL